MSVKPEGLFGDIKAPLVPLYGDIKTTNVFHHPVKAKSEFQYLYLHLML